MKRTYKVTGPTAYLGHKPGETFDAVLNEQQERRALERGSIKVVPKKDTGKGKQDDE